MHPEAGGGTVLSCILLLGCVDLVAGSTCRRCTRRGACLLCRLFSPLPLACFPATYPPSPRSQSDLPRRGRGRPKVYFAGGFAPGTPALNRLRHLQNLPPLYPAGRRACFAACYLPPLACFPAPYPPDPLPRRGRGRPKVYFAGGFAPGTPALNRLRHLQNLPPLYPAGRRACFAACYLPPLACFPAPYPPDPLPRRGRGRPKVYFAGGFAPGTPALNRLRHLQSLPLLCPAGACPAGHPPDSAAAVPGGGMNPSGTGYPCPGGEDHLKRRSSSPPVPPLLGCRHCSRESLSAVFAANHRFSPGDARGGSPLHKKTKNLPLPRRGRGLGGWGAESKLKAGGGRRQRRQAPRRVALTQVEPVPRPIQPRGCKGQKPLA